MERSNAELNAFYALGLDAAKLGLLIAQLPNAKTKETEKQLLADAWEMARRLECMLLQIALDGDK
jgi:hypothetical protein